jgi:methyl-accepting chemotaxis protein
MLAEPTGPEVHYDPRSSRRDKNLFAAVFLIGGAAIVLSKLLKLHTAVPVVGAVVSLITYAVLVIRVDKFRLREDRAGDNAYYLGFLFTLTSLSYALWAFQVGGEGAVRDVIGNFALALVSTIIGLAIRVWFQQLRDDPVEFEHEARLSLAEAAVEVRRQLIAVSDDIGLLRQRVHDELSHNFIRNAKDLNDAALGTMRQVAEAHSQWLATTAAELKTDREAVTQLSTGVRASLTKLVKVLETQAEAIETAEFPTDALRKRIEAAVVAMDQFVSKETERAERQTKIASDTDEILSRLLAAAKDLEPSVKAVVSAADATVASVHTTSEAVKRLSDSVDEAAKSVRSMTTTTLNEVATLAVTAKQLQEETKTAASALSSSVVEMSGDVVKVKKALVQTVDDIRRELDGGRS